MRSLMERISDPQAGIMLTEKEAALEVEHSVCREIERIFESRSYFSGTAASQPGRPTVLEFGVSNRATVDGVSQQHYERLALEIRRAVRSFEPRLRQLEVKVSSAQRKSYCIELTGVIKAGERSVPFRFNGEI